MHSRCISLESCLFLKSEGIDADIGGEDDLDNCLNFTLAKGEGEEFVPSAYQEDFDNEMEQTSEGSSDTEANEKEDSGDFIGFNL